MKDDNKKQPKSVETVTDKEDKDSDGRDLCQKCGNLMIEEGGEKFCSSCSEDIDFFGEDEDIEVFDGYEE